VLFEQPLYPDLRRGSIQLARLEDHPGSRHRHQHPCRDVASSQPSIGIPVHFVHSDTINFGALEVRRRTQVLTESRARIHFRSVAEAEQQIETYHEVLGLNFPHGAKMLNRLDAATRAVVEIREAAVGGGQAGFECDSLLVGVKRGARLASELLHVSEVRERLGAPGTGIDHALKAFQGLVGVAGLGHQTAQAPASLDLSFVQRQGLPVQCFGTGKITPAVSFQPRLYQRPGLGSRTRPAWGEHPTTPYRAEIMSGSRAA
jgi:hypothetical protein